ncbi:MAG: hypothetical protein EXS38_08025 [Opitutus sp.]|nr:hypothetical protein [Opitutus sp.]
MTLATADIAQLLECYVTPAEAGRRAQAIADDMAAIGFAVVRSLEVPDRVWQAHGARPQAEYVLPTTPFSINAEDGDQAMEGSSLTRGNLLRLSHAVDLGRKWLPELWPSSFATQLLGAGHLDTLNEIWWLKFWRGLVGVRRGPKLNAATPDVDWLLTIRDGLADCVVNLEVKRRTGNINAWFKHGNPTVSLRDVKKKFHPAGRETANLAALTVYHRPQPATVRQIGEWLGQTTAVDGVVVWIENNAGGEPLLKLIKSEKKWAEFLLRDPDPEDLMVAGLTKGTLCHPDEVPAFVDRLAATVRTRHP